MHKNDSNKKWLIKLGAFVGLLMLLLGLFNYLIDPLWCFSHSHWFTTYQKPFNERQQKTNYLTFVNTKKYDSLIIGNSRTSLINQNEFAGVSAYNYSVPGMTPYEYSEYIEFFKKVVGKPKTIYIGIDFGNTNEKIKFPAEMPAFYLSNVKSPFYRFKTLFTIDSLRYSLENLQVFSFIRKHKFGNGFILYDRNNIATLTKPSDESRRQDFITKELLTLRNMYSNHYIYRNDLAPFLKELVQANPETQFIPFTSPVSKLYFCTMVNSGKFPEYEKWLREMIEVFGNVWHFEYLNSITMDSAKNYSDSHHFYTSIGIMIANKITGVSNSSIPNDFGIMLNKKNIDAVLSKIYANTSLCR